MEGFPERLREVDDIFFLEGEEEGADLTVGEDSKRHRDGGIRPNADDCGKAPSNTLFNWLCSL